MTGCPAAIEAGMADFVLSPEAMPAKLIEYLQQSSYKRSKSGSLKNDDSNMKRIFSMVRPGRA